MFQIFRILIFIKLNFSFIILLTLVVEINSFVLNIKNIYLICFNLCATYFISTDEMDKYNYINSINIFKIWSQGENLITPCVCLVLMQNLFLQVLLVSNIGLHGSMQPAVYTHRGRLQFKPLASSDSGSKNNASI